MSKKCLREIYEECVVRTKSSPSVTVEKGRLHRWKGNITSFVSGNLQLKCVPHFGFVFDDDTAALPCILVDPLRNLAKLKEIHNSKILLNEPDFTIHSQEFCVVHVLLNIQKLKIIEKQPLHSILSHGYQNYIQRSEECIKFIPLRISSAILSPDSDVVCLVLVILASSSSQKRLWLILRNKEVIWKDFLIVNQLFTIRFPSTASPNYFINPSSLYIYFDSRWDISFQQILHHNDLITTRACAFLPTNSRIYYCNDKVEVDGCDEEWLDITDNVLKNLTFASVYGVIKEIRYLPAWKSFNCSWCNSFDTNMLEQSMSESYMENKMFHSVDNNLWISPKNFTTEIEEFELPDVDFFRTPDNKISGFGIRGGKLTIQIILQKKYSDNISYVFLKRWISSQYPAGLIPGVSVCFSNVNVKRSKKKFNYFISTPFTRIQHLETSFIENFTVPEFWGPFGFPYNRKYSQKIWGILDLDLLAKVSISAKCKLCQEPFAQYHCSNILCVNSSLKIGLEYEISALARIVVRTPCGKTCILFLKNDNVRKYLQIPERIWQKLCSLSALTELQYLHQGPDFDDHHTDFLNLFFRRYCRFFRPKCRFHVCCRPFKDSENRYFAIELAQIDESRVKATRNLLKSKATSSRLETATNNISHS